MDHTVDAWTPLASFERTFINMGSKSGWQVSPGSTTIYRPIRVHPAGASETIAPVVVIIRTLGFGPVLMNYVVNMKIMNQACICRCLRA